MKWQNLKNNKCPKCNKDLMKTMIPVGENNIGCNCGFVISTQRYKEITADQISKEIYGGEEKDRDESEEADFSGASDEDGEGR